MFDDKEHDIEAVREEEGRLFLQIFPQEIRREIDEYVVGDVVTDVAMDTGREAGLRFVVNVSDTKEILEKRRYFIYW